MVLMLDRAHSAPTTAMAPAGSRALMIVCDNPRIRSGLASARGFAEQACRTNDVWCGRRGGPRHRLSHTR